MKSVYQVLYLLSLALLLCLPVAVDAATNKIIVAFDGITFDSAYDNGALATLTRRALNDYDGTLYTDSGEKGTAKYWFRFKMTGVSGRTITLHLDHSQNPIPFIRNLSATPGPWRRMTTTEAPNTSTMIVTAGLGTNALELAFYEPYSYAETVAAALSLAATSPYVATNIICKSFENRDLHMLTINNPRYPSAGKKRVWVHARVHAGEVTATHTMLGFLSQVLEESETGRRLRENIIFTVVPQVNADGIYRGYTRWDSQGIDPESEWCDIRIPEVASLKTQIDSFMASPNPISVALNLHSTVNNFADAFFFKHLSPSVTATFEAIEQRYIDAVNAATPYFDNLAPATSQLNACTFVESYFWNNWGEAVMAMTQEGHYYHRVTDGAWNIGADYRELGRGEARALISYYNLPAVSEPDLTYAIWQTNRFTSSEIANSTISGPSADPDQDDLNNIWEYIFATAPKTGNPSPLTYSRTANSFILAFPRNQHLTDIKLYLQHSTDLINWTQEDLLTSTNITVSTTIDVPTANGYVDNITITHPSASSQRFYRLTAVRTF